MPQDFVYDDIFSGSELLNMFKEHGLGPQDITVSFSLDGAQLYQNKKSDTWIAIWIINDYSPTIWYKKKQVLPALVVPGPNKPKDLDSFMFRSFHHLSAIQRENGGAGIRTRNALLDATSLSRIFFILGTADAVGLTELDGRVGHHGAQGCRMSCDMKGRHKPRSGHYFAAHLRPNGTNADDCNHGDYDFRAVPQNPSSDTYQGGLVCAPRFPSGISRNRSDSDQNPIGNSGTQDHPNSREFVQFVRPDSDRKGQFRSDHSEPSPTNFRPISDRNQLVPTGSDRKNSQNSDKSLILIDHLT